jgi:predicted nucleic acid-binding protein
MIVLDASAVVELLTNGPAASSLRNDLAGRDDSFLAPHLIDVEVVSAMRKLAAGQRVEAHRSEQYLTGLATLPVQRFPHARLLKRMWELRHNFTAYDAAYVVLAEATNSVLYTCDDKLATGHRARVRVFSR